MTKSTIATLLLTALASAVSADPAPTGESRLLLPYFEVSLAGRAQTAFFSIVNTTDRELELTAKVYTNWAIPVLEVDVVLTGKQVLQVDLHDWLLSGRLPGGDTVCADGGADCLDLTHLQAALAGRPSTIDGLYYASELERGLATGFVTITAADGFLSEGLWGDYFNADPAERFAHGQRLMRLEPGLPAADLCRRHSIRFLEGGGFSGGTKLTLWSWDGNEGQPSQTPEPGTEPGEARIDVYSQQGELLEVLTGLPVLAAQSIRASDLGVDRPFGWFDLRTPGSSAVSGLYRAQGGFSAGVRSSCLPCDPCDQDGACYDPGHSSCAASCLPPRLTVAGTTQGEVGNELSLTYAAAGSPQPFVTVSELPFGLVHQSPKIFGIPALATSFTIRAKNKCGIEEKTIRIRPTVSFATSLRVVKEVVNDDGGTATADDFPLFIDGIQVQNGFQTPVSPGTHTVSEQNLPGYQAVGFRGDCDAAGRVTLAPGDDKVCILASDDVPAP